MKAKVHAFAGALALLMVCSFWSATALSELSGDASAVAAVKNGILAGMLVMVPAMAVAGASGFSLGKGWRSPAVARKKQRMKVIAANGILILLPSAVFLASKAGAGEFGTAFVAVQAVELAAGAVNIALLSMNMRDGSPCAESRRGREPTQRGPPEQFRPELRQAETIPLCR